MHLSFFYEWRPNHYRYRPIFGVDYFNFFSSYKRTLVRAIASWYVNSFNPSPPSFQRRLNNEKRRVGQLVGGSKGPTTYSPLDLLVTLASVPRVVYAAMHWARFTQYSEAGQYCKGVIQ